MTRIKRRIERFYEDGDEDTVFALYEDTEDNIHYRSIGYDGDQQQMLSQAFYKEYRLSALQETFRG